MAKALSGTVVGRGLCLNTTINLTPFDEYDDGNVLYVKGFRVGLGIDAFEVSDH